MYKCKYIVLLTDSDGCLAAMFVFRSISKRSLQTVNSEKIEITIFQRQNQTWLPVGNIQFMIHLKMRYAQLNLRGNLPVKFQKYPFVNFSEIALTNFQSQNQRWPPFGHVCFLIRLKMRYAQLDLRGNLPVKFQKDPFSTFWEKVVTFKVKIQDGHLLALFVFQFVFKCDMQNYTSGGTFLLNFKKIPTVLSEK